MLRFCFLKCHFLTVISMKDLFMFRLGSNVSCVWVEGKREGIATTHHRKCNFPAILKILNCYKVPHYERYKTHNSHRRFQCYPSFSVVFYNGGEWSGSCYRSKRIKLFFICKIILPKICKQFFHFKNACGIQVTRQHTENFGLIQFHACLQVL